MLPILTFIAGVVVGVLYEPALKPIVRSLWKRAKDWINRTPKDPLP
jgi:hypothetical protein